MTSPAEELADACVELTQRAAGPEVTDDARARLVELLGAAQALLPPVPESRFTDDERAGFAAGTVPIDVRGTHPVRGLASPTRVGLLDPDPAEPTATRVRFDVRHEGPPGTVHGYFVSGLFDVVLGGIAIAAGGPGVTASLTVEFLRPTPLHRPIRFGGVAEPDGDRRTLVTGRAVDEQDGTELARATCAFVHRR